LKVFRIIVQIAGLYVLYLIGQWIQQTLGIPIPGSIIGLILLFLLLISGIIRPLWLESGASFLLAWLPLLFLPSIVGVMNDKSFFFHRGIWLVLLIAVNTVIVMALSSWVTQRLANRKIHQRGNQQ